MKKVVAVISVVLLYTILGIWLLDISMFVELTRMLMLLFVGVLGLLFLTKGFYWYATFMMGGRKAFNKQVDRPRVFLFSILFPALNLIYLTLKTVSPYFLRADTSVTAQTLTVLYFSVIIALFSVFAMLLFFTFSKKFEQVYLPGVKKAFQRFEPDFKSTLDSNTVEEIFDRMVENGFLSYEDLEEQNEQRKLFVEIFVTGKLPEEQLFFLHLSNRQIMIFYKHFAEKLEKFDLHHIVRIFKNKNRKLSVESIKESYRLFEKKQKEKGTPKVRVKDQNKIEWLFKVN